jgi:hypothetical protein
MRPKYFEYEGNLFMIVRPVSRLHNSTTIKEIVNRGDKFVVNMSTGSLTVFNMKEKRPRAAVKKKVAAKKIARRKTADAYFVHAVIGMCESDWRIVLTTDLEWSICELYRTTSTLGPYCRIALHLKNARTNTTYTIIKNQREHLDTFIPRMRTFYERTLRERK